MTTESIASRVGLWWPATDAVDLRAAAAAWERSASALDHAADVGSSGAALAGTRWSGAGADAFTAAWRRHEIALRDDAAGARALAQALHRYADAVAAAKRKVEELAVTAGATIVVGVGLAWLTFGASTVAAAGVSAGLVAAAEAVGVELSATAATITGGALTGIAFGAGGAAVVDMAVSQPLRVEAFHDGGYSSSEVGGAALGGGLIGGLAGGVGSGVAGGLARATGAPGRAASPASSAPRDLREVDSAISAALDPSYRGSLGPLFRAEVSQTPRASLPADRLPAARLLTSEGHSVHARADAATGPNALVRSSGSDPGRYTELATPSTPTPDGIEDTILSSGARLARYGTGDLVVDGRAAGLSVDAAGDGLSRAVERAESQGLALPATIRFVFDDMSIHYP